MEKILNYIFKKDKHYVFTWHHVFFTYMNGCGCLRFYRYSSKGFFGGIANIEPWYDLDIEDYKLNRLK